MVILGIPNIHILSQTEQTPPKTQGDLLGLHLQGLVKQVHPDTGVSSKAISIMNSFVNDTFVRIASEALRLAHLNGGSIISSREIQTSVRMLWPGEFASESSKAVTIYISSKRIHISVSYLI